MDELNKAKWKIRRIKRLVFPGYSHVFEFYWYASNQMYWVEAPTFDDVCKGIRERIWEQR